MEILVVLGSGGRTAHIFASQKHFSTHQCSVQAPARWFATPNLRFEALLRRAAKQKPQPVAGTYVLAPEAGLEPATSKLTASCSTIELLRKSGYAL